MHLYFVMLKLAYNLMFIDKFMNILSSNNVTLLYLFSMLWSTLVKLLDCVKLYHYIGFYKVSILVTEMY